MAKLRDDRSRHPRRAASCARDGRPGLDGAEHVGRRRAQEADARPRSFSPRSACSPGSRRMALGAAAVVSAGDTTETASERAVRASVHAARRRPSSAACSRSSRSRARSGSRSRVAWPRARRRQRRPRGDSRSRTRARGDRQAVRRLDRRTGCRPGPRGAVRRNRASGLPSRASARERASSSRRPGPSQRLDAERVSSRSR